MQELLEWMEYIEDKRQQRKVCHTLKDILVIVLFATLANADDWVEMALFAEDYQDYLRKYIELKNGSPSHDTIRRVMGMVSPEILQQLYTKYQTEDIGWVGQKKEWKGLKSIVMEKKTLEKDGIQKEEYRYFISSLREDIELVSRAVRGH